jgi:UDP-3-O-[3-hydroxymyristoyl] glucosamine N-acyltransferase
MTIEEIIAFIKPIEFNVVHASPIIKAQEINSNSFDDSTIGWCADSNLTLLQTINKGTILLSEKLNNSLNESKMEICFNRIIVRNPRQVFAKILKQYFLKPLPYGIIHSTAFVHESSIINTSTCIIGAHVVIEEDVQLGDYVQIDANSVIKSGTVIEDHVKIGANCTIGGVGFGYELNEDGTFELIPHIGNVLLKKHVEIGNNVCIDRAVMGSTILEQFVKVDNLVHIAHGVHIDENSLIIAHAMIAGSAKIGKNAWISPSSSIKQKLTIGNNTIIGLGSVVIKDVEDNEIVAGVPARKIEKNK